MKSHAMPSPTDLTDLRPEWYTNRDLSWLEFNRRVLEEARDPSNPLLERVKFLAIFDSNLSEFFEVRVSALSQQAEAGVARRDADGLSPRESLDAIRVRVRELVNELYECWNKEVLPSLEKEGIHVLHPNELEPEDADWLDGFFDREIFPVLTPISVDPAHPFPHVVSKSLNIAALLQTDDPDEPDRLAVVQVPRVLPRILTLPWGPRRHGYVFLADTIRQQLPKLFPGATILDHTAFRLTRNSNLYVDEDEVENLLTAIERELRRRRRGEAVRLEVRFPVGPRLKQELLEVFDLESSDLYECRGPVNLARVVELAQLENAERLKDPPHRPTVHPALREPSNVFASIRGGDVLLHHPFDYF
jgi:polyphosphate kinase